MNSSSSDDDDQTELVFVILHFVDAPLNDCVQAFQEVNTVAPPPLWEVHSKQFDWQIKVEDGVRESVCEIILQSTDASSHEFREGITMEGSPYRAFVQALREIPNVDEVVMIEFDVED